MKRLFYILILITGMTNAQIVDIPDANFKAALVSANTNNEIAGNRDNNGNVFYIVLDANNDGEIQVSEANSITYLKVYGQNISDLTGIQYFTNLEGLDCYSNNLTSLNVSGMTSLIELSCFENNLTSLNVSGMTSLLRLDCSMNNLTSLNTSDLMNLDYLNCNSNNLTSLMVSGMTSLLLLYCSNNNLTNIELIELPNLFEIGCSINPLSTLDVSALSNLQWLYCESSPLTYINLKNGRSFSAFYFYNTPNLQFICAEDSMLEFIRNSIYFMPTTVLSSYCTFTPGGNYNIINGSMIFDVDYNGCDVTDAPQPNIRVNINDGTNQGATFTNNSGNYTFYTQTGSFDLTPNVENPTWFTFSPPNATAIFADNNNNTTIQNFCISDNGVHPDLEVVIAPITPTRPGFDATYKIVYKNKGNQTLSGNVTFSYDDAVLDFVSATVVPNSQSLGTLSWNYTNLLPFESRSFEIVLNVNAPTETPAVNIGDILNFSASVNPIAGDEIPSDNTFNYNETVVGSYDPNDITCLEGDIVSPSEIGNYLHYNIRFENTGTAAAEFVVVKVEVNQTDFDMSSLQIMNSSDPVYTRINQNIVEFIFQNIQLESGGHGNILLKIKSKNNLLVGDEVNKKANIYFDYNFPILTNDAETVFQALNNPDFQNDASITVYPNPTNGIVTVNCNNSIKSIQLYDVQGRLLQTNLVNENETTIDVSTKSKGVYFLKILSDKGMKVEKIVRE